MAVVTLKAGQREGLCQLREGQQGLQQSRIPSILGAVPFSVAQLLVEPKGLFRCWFLFGLPTVQILGFPH